jgi:hypothetical protein
MRGAGNLAPHHWELPGDEFSDQDATWGHRSAVSTRKGGGYYGYKLHMAACTCTGLPVAWTVETASGAGYKRVTPLGHERRCQRPRVYTSLSGHRTAGDGRNGAA